MTGHPAVPETQAQPLEAEQPVDESSPPMCESCTTSSSKALEVEQPNSTAQEQPIDVCVDPGLDSQDSLHGWRRRGGGLSLEESWGTVRVPAYDASWYRWLFAFGGLGLIISVGYMDPGNWATDIAGGAGFGYLLLIVILLASLSAMFLQHLSLKLGVIAERDLAQACRDAYNKKVVYVLWFLAEIAIAATDLAEVIGSAVALYLLFNIPIWAGVLITSADVLFVILFGVKSFRLLELLIMSLCLLIASCFAYELVEADPDWVLVAKGFIPRSEILTNSQALFTAIGILGATVMPHNLYLHSSIVQTRAYTRDKPGKRMAIKYGTLDSNLSLSLAFFVNASILIVAAAVFHYGPNADTTVADITTAYKLLAPAVGAAASSKVFAIALLASGQQSTITGTLAGQIVMEGFLQISLPPWARRLVTRLIAIVPAVIVAGISGPQAVGKLLVLSQVILSLQLPFAVFPLVQFTSSRGKMGSNVNRWYIKTVGWAMTAIIAGLNVYLIIQSIRTNEFSAATVA